MLRTIDLISKRGMLCIILLIVLSSCQKDSDTIRHEKFQVAYSGDAKIEVGGPYIGVEFHHSSPLAQRISFFYPVANSIDLSSDYWKRDTTHIMMLGLKIGNNPKEWIGFTPNDFDLTPYSVSFINKDTLKSIKVSYHFCKTKPAMIVIYNLKNLTSQSEQFQFDTHMDLSLRTCHSFNEKSQAWVMYDEQTSTLYANHSDPETQNASVFVANAGEIPDKYGCCGPLADFLPQNNDNWDSSLMTIPDDSLVHPAARFFYRHNLAAGESMKIVQIIGSCKQYETEEMVNYLIENYKHEIKLYEQSVLNKICAQNIFETGDPIIDHSVTWSQAILVANYHYLDGEFVPMPCPAEYNFYFAHDVLVTDLAAANFDLQRVRQDLDYIRRHSNEDLVIPHAYYWKDSTFVTEYANEDNWNNFWMIIVTASYLRHSADTAFVNTLYPYLSGCLERALRTKQEDNLMWSVQPDWWDIGENWGPRSYMTILAVKALRDYIYVSSALSKNLDILPEYEDQADAMQQALLTHLWDEKMFYLINYYEDKSLDPHYYIGSLLAAHYQLLDERRRGLLVESAQKNLLEKNLGIYNVYPMDFDKLIDYLKFVGNEAGAQYYYCNGGIWPQGNAWYALALIADKQKNEALEFIKTTMTLKGIMAGPNGQPAMYEVRTADPSDPKLYGTVDKPQFMWAAGWYLYSLYHLFGIQEDNWNVAFDPYASDQIKNYKYTLWAHGKNYTVTVGGEGNNVACIESDAGNYPGTVIPLNLFHPEYVRITLGNPRRPIITKTNSILISSDYQETDSVLRIRLKAFKKHHNTTHIISPHKISSVSINGTKVKNEWEVNKQNSYYEFKIHTQHNQQLMELSIEFDK